MPERLKPNAGHRHAGMPSPAMADLAYAYSLVLLAAPLCLPGTLLRLHAGSRSPVAVGRPAGPGVSVRAFWRDRGKLEVCEYNEKRLSGLY